MASYGHIKLPVWSFLYWFAMPVLDGLECKPRHCSLSMQCTCSHWIPADFFLEIKFGKVGNQTRAIWARNENVTIVLNRPPGPHFLHWDFFPVLLYFNQTKFLLALSCLDWSWLVSTGPTSSRLRPLLGVSPKKCPCLCYTQCFCNSFNEHIAYRDHLLIRHWVLWTCYYKSKVNYILLYYSWLGYSSIEIFIWRSSTNRPKAIMRSALEARIIIRGNFSRLSGFYIID